MGEIDVFKFFFSQGMGWAIASIIGYVYWKEKQRSDKNYQALLTTRKSDRDDLMKIMGRIETHLAKEHVFEGLCHDVIKDVVYYPGKRRRKVDRIVEVTLRKERALAHDLGIEDEDLDHD